MSEPTAPYRIAADAPFFPSRPARSSAIYRKTLEALADIRRDPYCARLLDDPAAFADLAADARAWKPAFMQQFIGEQSCPNTTPAFVEP